MQVDKLLAASTAFMSFFANAQAQAEQRLFLLYSGNILLKEFCALTFATLKLVKSQSEMKKKVSKMYQHSAFVQVGGVMLRKINVL